MKFVSEAAMQRLENRIRSIEQRTTGELITVITDRSDDYRYIALLCAALAALSVPGLAVLFGSLFSDAANPAGTARFGTIYAIQGAVFAGLGMLFIWSPFRMTLIPASVKQKRASRLAHRQFDKMILAQLQSPIDSDAGELSEAPVESVQSVPVVMLFVSVAEHYVEIITNVVASEAIPDSVWDGIVDEFIEAVQRDEVQQGFENAIARTGLELVKYFPAVLDETDSPLPNRLPDRLIEISH